MRTAYLLILLGFIHTSCQICKNNKVSSESAQVKKHEIYIDAGSSGSRLFIYEWEQDKSNEHKNSQSLPEITQLSSDYAVDVPLGSEDQNITNSLGPLCDFSIKVLKKIYGNNDFLKMTPVHIKATAGLRLLGEKKSQEALTKALDFIRKKGFTSPQNTAEVITGEEEAYFSWLSVNYLYETFIGQKNNKHGINDTYGSLDLGGASTQITFAIPAESAHYANIKTTILGVTYNLLSRSFLGYGADQFRIKYANSYCFPKGFKNELGSGNGDFDLCVKNILPHVFSWNEIIKPDHNMRFIGMSAYLHTARFLGLEGNVPPKKMQEAGRQFCQMSFDEMLKKYDEEPKYISRYCFQAAYIYSLLSGQSLQLEQKGFDFDPQNEKIIFNEKITTEDHGVQEVSWALGALLQNISGTSPIIK